jgi:hypothetical protein
MIHVRKLPPKAAWSLLMLLTPVAAAGGDTPAGRLDTEKGITITVLDAATRKPIPRFRILAGVPSGVRGAEEFVKRTGLSSRDVANWQLHTLKIVENGTYFWSTGRTYPEMALRVEADGYQPQRTQWIVKSQEPEQIEFLLDEDHGIRGRVLQPDGLPAAGATIALALPQRDAVVENGTLRGMDRPRPQNERDGWRRPHTVKTDAEGRFRFPIETDAASAILILHDSGVCELPYPDFRRRPAVLLKRWGQIDGRILWKDAPGVDEPVDLIIFRDEYGYPGMIASYADSRTDAQGRFNFEKVLPGRVQISRPISIGTTGVVLPGLVTHLDVRAGETTEVLLGGQGRTVRGRLIGRDSWDDVTFHFHPTAPHIGFPGDDDSWKGFAWFRRSPIGPLFFRDKLNPNADGSFEIPHMLPGSYQLFVSAPGVQNYAGTAQFNIEAEIPGEPPPPLDLPEIVVRAAEANP